VDERLLDPDGQSPEEGWEMRAPPLHDLRRRDGSRGILLGAAYSMLLAVFLGASVSVAMPFQIPVRGTGVDTAGARRQAIAENLVQLGYFLAACHVVVCLLLMMATATAVSRWSEVAVRFWALGKFFFGTLIGTVLGIGSTFLVCLLLI
jgi:hypothetical protein